MLRYLFKTVQGGISRAELSPGLAEDIATVDADKLEDNEVNWRCSGDSWRSGATAVNNDRLTSYDFIDEILRKLASKDVFPNLSAIVAAGHSAGGQYVSRYAMANQVHEGLGVPVTYVVSNPSSYAYLDASRPRDGGGLGAYQDRRNCTTYDRWPFGLQNRTGYAARLTGEHQGGIARRQVNQHEVEEDGATHQQQRAERAPRDESPDAHRLILAAMRPRAPRPSHSPLDAKARARHKSRSRRFSWRTHDRFYV
jgi:hypothetical protein